MVAKGLRGVITGIEVPLELAAMLCVTCGLAGAWVTHNRIQQRLGVAGASLGAMIRGEMLTGTIDLAAYRNARRAGAQALLHGRIDQLAALHPGETDARMREQIAAVMRAGLRRGDSMATTDGDGFTITVSGADESAALRIAERLGRRLAQLRLQESGPDTRLSARFGVAAQRIGEDEHALARRARRALDAAITREKGHVVPASEIEEIRLLPAPEAPAPASSSSAAA